MSLRSLDYWSSMLPLALAHCLVPPLSGNGALFALGLPRWLEDLALALQLPLAREDIERHFLHSEAAARAHGRGYTLLSHMLLPHTNRTPSSTARTCADEHRSYG